MKQYIGGFFELETIPAQSSGYHSQSLALTNARACISYIIQHTDMQKVWLPYYTCDALLEPFQVAGVEYEFYELNKDLELLNLPKLDDKSFIVYVDYFALKTSYVRKLVEHYGGNLLVDNTQNFFSKGYSNSWAFNSARKFFGVPDGGYLYGPEGWIIEENGIPKNTRFQVQHLIERSVGKQAEGYASFVAYEKTLNSEVLRISDFSSSLLGALDFENSAQQRLKNFKIYHQTLGRFNEFSSIIDQNIPDLVPFSYPFVSKEVIDINKLFAKNIFIPRLWNDVSNRIRGEAYSLEKMFTERLLSLPVDHRYGPQEIEYVIENVLALI